MAAMKIPTEEIIVFGPLVVAALVYGGRQLYLAFRYRHVA